MMGGVKIFGAYCELTELAHSRATSHFWEKEELLLRGRKPTPTTLKLLRGNPGHRPMPPDEPRPPAVMPKCPVHLDKEARAEWRRMVKELEPLGILTKLDKGIFALYCQAFSTWAQASIKIQELGMVRMTKNGFTEQNPYFSIANKAKEQMVRALTEMGMTPSSRTRVRAIEPASWSRNKKERFF